MIKRTIKYYLASLVLFGISAVTTVGLARSPATPAADTACQDGTTAITNYLKTSKKHVRCVRKK